MSTRTQLKEYAASTRQPFAEPRVSLSAVPADRPHVHAQDLGDVCFVQAAEESQ